MPRREISLRGHASGKWQKLGSGAAEPAGNPTARPGSQSSRMAAPSSWSGLSVLILGDICILSDGPCSTSTHPPLAASPWAPQGPFPSVKPGPPHPSHPQIWIPDTGRHPPLPATQVPPLPHSFRFNALSPTPAPGRPAGLSSLPIQPLLQGGFPQQLSLSLVGYSPLAKYQP